MAYWPKVRTLRPTRNEPAWSPIFREHARPKPATLAFVGTVGREVQMPIRTCRWERRNTSGRKGDFDETWIRFQLGPPPGSSGGGPERRDVTVTLSRSLGLEWGLSEPDRGPVLFWSAVYEGLVKGQSEVNLTTDNAPPDCPIEWKRPEPPRNEPFEIDFPVRPIGFGG